MNTAPSTRTQVRRGAPKASYDPAVLHAIVDAAYVCQIAFADAHGVHCIPTACWRGGGDYLYIHGSNGSRMLQCLMEQDCCVTIVHVDGLVLARSAFSHTMNYRSAMVLGHCTVLHGRTKELALRQISEHLMPGRWDEIRGPSAQELKATAVLELPLDECSLKVSAGGPDDDPADLALPVWAGRLPLTRQWGKPVPADDLDPEHARIPEYIDRWRQRIS